MPLHPKAREFAKSGLFSGLSSFEDLEKRIAAISKNKGKGDACLKLPGGLVFVHGFVERHP